MGHSISMLLSTYVHVIADLKGRDAVDAEAEIRAARAAVARDRVASKLTSSEAALTRGESPNEKTPPGQGFSEEPTPRFELGTLHYEF
jgi:hypothetical protein